MPKDNFKGRMSLSWIFVDLIKISRNYLKWVWGNLISKIVFFFKFYIIFEALIS